MIEKELLKQKEEFLKQKEELLNQKEELLRQREESIENKKGKTDERKPLRMCRDFDYHDCRWCDGMNTNKGCYC